MSTETEPDHRAFFEVLSRHIGGHIPGFEVRFKPEHRGQRVLALLLRPFVPGYLQQYTTTLYPRVYYPDREELSERPASAWETLAHEYVHLWDHRREPFWFPLGYVLPQALAVFSVGALAALWASPWALVCLAFLAALAPWPSPARTRAEVRGYAMDLAVRYWLDGRPWGIQAIKRNFTGWAYYRMCPSQKRVDALFEQVLENLRTRDLPVGPDEDDEPYRQVRALMTRHGMRRHAPPVATTAP